LGNVTYLVFELGWGIPVLALQWGVGWRTLSRYIAILAVATILATVYLSVADGVAIHEGIWALHRDRITGLYLDDVPLEEVIFFLLTDLMVVQSVILVTCHSWRRQRDRRESSSN